MYICIYICIPYIQIQTRIEIYIVANMNICRGMEI